MDHISLVDKAGRTKPLVTVEREATLAALERSDWNIRMAARALGVSYVTIYKRLRHYGVKLPDVRNRAAADKTKERT